MRNALRALGAIVLFLVASPAWAGALPVTKRVLSEKSSGFDISVAYPQTGLAGIDRTLAAYAKEAVIDFKAQRQPQDPAYTLDTTYDVARNDATVFAVVFSIYTDAGGAHPNQNYATFDFLLPDGAQVMLPEILAGRRGIQRLSDLVTADLMKRLSSGAEPISDPDTIKMGSGPYADNFKDFILFADRIRILFPPYQVASYAAGPQDAIVPLASLKDVMRSDWRAPAPSFDCALARSPIEHAICSDSALARLDREVNEQYQRQLRDSYQPGGKDKLKEEQRQFVTNRNIGCGDAPAMVTCLTTVYSARLKVLSEP